MGDEHVGQPHIILKVHEQVQYLRLDGYVQGGYRLIADNEFGIHGKGPGNADPLAPSAVQFMGIRILQTGRQPHGLHQFLDPFL